MNQNITNEAQKNFLITDLITWKDYIVQIAAYNDMGVGVFTNELKIKTKEGGMLGLSEKHELKTIYFTQSFTFKQCRKHRQLMYASKP